MTKHVLLATCAELPTGDGDDSELVGALANVGVNASWQIWDDPSATWSADLVVIRSTWDYTARRPQFLTWARAVPVLANPADVLAWNSDKTYLRALAEQGVPIVPTTWAEPGVAADFPAGEFVVKPSVGAGSRGAGRFDPTSHPAARDHLAALHSAGRTAMVQPYLDAVDSAGETALLYFGGTFSHAIRKAPMLPTGAAHAVDHSALYLEEHISPRVPSAAEFAVAEKVLASVPPLLYARVDLLPSPDGPVLIELEAIEPSLFFAHAAGSVQTYAAAVARWLVR